MACGDSISPKKWWFCPDCDHMNLGADTACPGCGQTRDDKSRGGKRVWINFNVAEFDEKRDKMISAFSASTAELAASYVMRLLEDKTSVEWLIASTRKPDSHGNNS